MAKVEVTFDDETMQRVVKTVYKRDKKLLGKKPTTVAQALQQAHKLLSVEDRWTKDWFEDGDPKTVYENGSLCGSWSVCVLSAIALVTGEGKIRVECTTFKDHEDDELANVEVDSEFCFDNTLSSAVNGTGLTSQCYEHLNNTLPEIMGVDGELPVDDTMEFNDYHLTTLEDVLKLLTLGIKSAKEQGI